MLGELCGEALSQADPHVRRWTPTQGGEQGKSLSATIGAQQAGKPDMESSHKATWSKPLGEPHSDALFSFATHVLKLHALPKMLSFQSEYVET